MLRTTRTAQRARATFLAELAKGLTVSGSAEAALLPRTTVYAWRNADPEFAMAWEEAVESGTDRLEDEAFRRAYHGVAEPLTSQGKLQRDEAGAIITVQKYSDALMTTLLKARRPAKFRERVSTEISGPDGAALSHPPVTISVVGIPAGYFFDADGNLAKDTEA